jgi:hypothetical protein
LIANWNTPWAKVEVVGDGLDSKPGTGLGGDVGGDVFRLDPHDCRCPEVGREVTVDHDPVVLDGRRLAQHDVLDVVTATS